MSLNRLWCFIVGHKQIRVFDKVELREAALMGLSFNVIEQHKKCSRCEKRLK